MTLSRRTFGKLVIGGAALAAPMLNTRAWAQGKTIQIGIWGGSQGNFVRREIIPAFEKEFDCRIVAEEGFTLANVGKLRATKDNSEYSVMFIDDVAIPICKAEGLIEQLPAADMPALESLYPRFGFDGWGTALAISVGSMFYNTSITPPATYAALWGPEYEGKLKLVSPKNTPSVFFLIVAAAVKSGKPIWTIAPSDMTAIRSATRGLATTVKPSVSNAPPGLPSKVIVSASADALASSTAFWSDRPPPSAISAARSPVTVAQSPVLKTVVTTKFAMANPPDRTPRSRRPDLGARGFARHAATRNVSLRLA